MKKILFKGSLTENSAAFPTLKEGTCNFFFQDEFTCQHDLAVNVNVTLLLCYVTRYFFRYVVKILFNLNRK